MQIPYKPSSLVVSEPASGASPIRWEQFLSLLTRVLVWGLFFGLLTLMSSFFVLIFLTFVFAYLQTGAINQLLKYAPRRRTALVILTSLLFLVSVIALGTFVAPKVYQQAAGFAKSFPDYMQRMDTELLDLAARYPMLQEAIPELRQGNGQQVPDWAVWPLASETNGTHRLFRDSPSGMVLELLAGDETNGRESIKLILDQLANVSRKAIAFLGTFLLAFLFSFLIVLDLPHLAASVRDLGNTRLSFIYHEVADNIYQFGRVLGSAIQAQFYIACVNTVLTALGLWALGMGEQVAFLSVIVFVCGFVPVAGVFISSVPICLIALNSGGADLMLLCIGLIVVVHLLEGYLLNPLIYGARMRINPVIVLIILTVGGKLFHVWGLILGVPVCIYIFGHAIRYRKGEKPLSVLVDGPAV